MLLSQATTRRPSTCGCSLRAPPPLPAKATSACFCRRRRRRGDGIAGSRSARSTSARVRVRAVGLVLGLGSGLGLGLERVDSVPYPPAHSRASSISLPAISADATRWSGAAGRRGTAQGCTQAVSASTTRATCLARSRQCALRSGAQQGPLDLTTCDQRGRDASAGRCGAVWDCRNGSSRAAEAPRQGRARAAQAARVPRAAAPPMALRRELAGEDERLAGRPPSGERVPHRDGAAA